MLISDFWTALRKGQELTHAETWKNRAVAGGAVSSLLFAAVGIARAFGYALEVDDQTLEAAGAGIAALVTLASSVLHVVTSARVGLPAALGGADPGPGQPPGNGQRPGGDVGAGAAEEQDPFPLGRGTS